MIDEVSDVLGWNRKHAIKALNGKVCLGQKARRRGSKATYSEEETAVIVGILEAQQAALRHASQARFSLRHHGS
jgi:hypothetical protein